MNDVLRDRLVSLGLDPAAAVQDTLTQLWLMSCASDALWAWPWRTGEVLENVFHVHFTDHDDVRTLITVNDDWLALQGAHITPVRVLRLSDDAAWAFVDTVSRALAEKTVRVWTWFGDWWVQFRTEHSELVGHTPPAPQPTHSCDH